MNQGNYYISLKDLANAVGCSYSTLHKKHLPRIISLYHIDRSRMPTHSVLPIDACEAYFGIDLKISNKKTR